MSCVLLYVEITTHHFEKTKPASAGNVFVFQTNIVVEVPHYNKKTSDPVPVQFYISNGKRRKSPAQNFTYHPSAAAAPLVKQELWQLEHVSLHPTVAFYDSNHETPPLHHPPVSSTHLFPHTSPIAAQTSAPCPPLTPLQTFTAMPARSFTSLPLQASCAVPQRDQAPCVGRSFEAQRSSPAQVLSIKQEPEEQTNSGSLGLQEITLDDGEHPSNIYNPLCPLT